MTSICRACSAKIIWAVTPAGKRMPVDAKPSADGKLILSAQVGPQGIKINDPPLVIDERTVDQDGPKGGDRYISHFATCPAADRFRR